MPDLVTPPTPPTAAPNVTTTISTSGGVVVAPGDLRYATAIPYIFEPSDFDAHATSYVLTNAGTIWNDYAPGAEVMNLMNWGEIDNEGSIVAHSSDGDAHTLWVTSSFGQGLNNSGSIYALSDSHGAWAFADWSQNAIINNSGLIAARGGASARGLTLHNGGVVVNRSGGSILAEGPDAVAVYFGRGHYQVPGQSPTATDLTNWGHIEAQSTGATLSSVAVYLAHLSIESMVIDNHGTIVGDFAIYSDPTAFTPPQNSAELVTNESDGIITGEISLDLGDDRIVNNGQITGYIDMGAGNDVVDDRLGTHAGDTELGWGNDSYFGGSDDDAATGNRGDDTILGGGGNDLLLGGWGDDTVQGDAGNDGLYGEGGNDTITTSGGDYVDAGDGDDHVILDDYSFAKVVGGPGFDVLSLPADGRILSLSQALSGGRVSGFEEISLADGGQIVIHAGDVAEMGDTVLTISGRGSGVVDLAGSWIEGAGQTTGGITYSSYSSGGSVVLIANGLTVDLGSDPGTAVGLDGVAGGAVAPLPGAVPGAELTSNDVTASRLELTSDLKIYAAEHWTSPDGSPIITGSSGQAASFTNWGTMESDAGASDDAEVLRGSNFKDIANYGTMVATAMSPNDHLADNKSSFETYGLYNSVGNLEGANGVNLGGNADSFLNAGTIDAESLQSMAVGYLTYTARGQNTGLIEARSTDFVAVGVYTHNGSTFINSGTISATGGWGAYGFGSTEARLNLINSGTITAHSTDPSHPGIGLDLSYAFGTDHITNSGTIAGDIAIETEFTINGDNLWLNNSGQINGAIELGVGYGSFARDDVILNNGAINGDVRLGAGRDVYDGRHGTQSGAVYGEDGNDLLIGTSGHDILDGGAGTDVLIGGDGDSLTGGSGADTFIFTSMAAGQSASITDFNNGADVLDLRSLGATSISISGSIVTATIAGGTWPSIPMPW